MTQPTAFQQGRYEVRYEMGRDACGVMLLAIDNKIASREVLLRRIAENTSPGLMQRVAQITHPTLPPVYDSFEEAGHRYLVQEHPGGQSLADIVLGPPLKEQVVVAWARQIAAGLNYLHQQRPVLFHGDIRPTNVVLQDGRQIKLVGGLPSGCAALPPSRYSAPERWNGAPPDPLSDQYAFAATLHHLVTGVDPNTQPLNHWVNPASHRSGISAALSDVLMHALSGNPSHRFASLDMMMQALVSSVGTQVSPVVPRTPPSRAAEGATKNMQSVPPASVRSQSVPPPLPPRQAPLPPRTAPRTMQDQDDPRDRGSTWGPLVLGMLLALVVLGGLGLFVFRSLGSPTAQSTPLPLTGDFTSVNNLTPTGDDGRELSDAERTSTALALNLPPLATPTVGPDQQTAEAEVTAITATAAAGSNQIEALYQAGLQLENAGQFALALDQYRQVLLLDPLYKDTPERVNNVQFAVDSTATAADAQATAAADAQATAAAETAIAAVPTPTFTPELPTPTFTPELPTPTPEGRILGEPFDGDALDPALWTTRPGDGEITVADGELVLVGDDANCFPLVQYRLPEPQTADFDLEIVFEYRDVTSLGTGIIIASQPAETCGPTDRSGDYWFGIWQDDQSGLVFDFHREFDPERGPEENLREPLSDGLVNTEQHTFRVERRGGFDTFTLDDVVITTQQAGEELQVLWFGNSTRSAVAGKWTTVVVKDVLWE